MVAIGDAVGEGQSGEEVEVTTVQDGPPCDASVSTSLASWPVLTLEEIKKLMLKPATFPGKKKLSSSKTHNNKQGRRKGGGGGRKKPHTHNSTSTSAKGNRLDQEKEDEEKLEIVRWDGHERVVFVIFPNRVALRNGVTRLSVFLEDPIHAGTVVGPDVRPGKYVAASYTGHNFRPKDLRQFIEQVKANEVQLEKEEERLYSTLADELPGVADETSDETWGCIATARGLNGGEVASTLLHESMHGLFYAYRSLEKATWRFWEEELSSEQQSLWRRFLGSLGYNGENNELCVNEMLAYLSTERELLKRSSIQSVAEADQCNTLDQLQKQFVAFIKAYIPLPKPHLPGQYCAFV